VRIYPNNESVGVKHDEMYLNGQGANDEPLGILNTPGVTAIAFGGAPTFATIVSFETDVEKANADGAGMAYITTPGAKGILKTTAVALAGATTVSSRALWENGNFGDGSNDGLVNAYRAASTNQIPGDRVVFGRWSELFCGQWGGFDLVVDYWTKAKNAEIVLTANTWIDSALRHAQSFTVSSDSGAQ
jgi:HK97 family phage major capsid protein